MFLLKVVTVLLPLVGVLGINVALTGLIRRIINDNGLTAVYAIGRGEHYFGAILSDNVDIPVMVLSNLSAAYGGEFRMKENGVLVVEALRGGPRHVSSMRRLIAGLRLRKFVVVLADSPADLRGYFAFFAEQKFTRIFGVTGGVHYAYLQYSDSPLRRFSLGGPLPDALKDLNGRAVRITAIDDLPRVYRYRDKLGRRRLTGYAGEMFLGFLRKHNATFVEIKLSDVDTQFMTILVNATVDDDIDFSVNPYDHMEGVQMSYPIYLLNWGIMVPIAERLDPTQYFVRPFTPAVWTCIGLTLVYIIAMHLVKDCLTHTPVDIWGATSQTILTMLAMAPEKPVRRAYRVHFLVVLFGFIVGSLYSTLLSSFLTVFIKVKQSETIQDMIENDIPLMMVAYEWETARDDFRDMERIVVPVENSVFLRERNSMNTAFAYAVGMDKAEYLIHMQATYAKPQFHTIRDSLSSYFVGYLLAKHSPFLEPLSLFIIEVQATGLMEKWSQDAVRWGILAGLVNATHTSKEPTTPLTLNHFHLAWMALGSGLIISSIVFVAERRIYCLK